MKNFGFGIKRLSKFRTRWWRFLLEQKIVVFSGVLNGFLMYFVRCNKFSKSRRVSRCFPVVVILVVSHSPIYKPEIEFGFRGLRRKFRGFPILGIPGFRILWEIMKTLLEKGAPRDPRRGCALFRETTIFVLTRFRSICVRLVKVQVFV